MTSYTWLGAALLAVAFGSHADAQAVISEPGYCAQFYPNANCQNKGPGNPYTDPNYHRTYGGGSYWQSNNAQMIEPQVIAPRHRHHRSHRHPH